ncbi:alpha/beta fold hydrolase [Nonomuraea glycinis]|uniref:alpha/beta fold hydrolase n=1 Tax=Nonomuraea glycinis TaxID=2047744 RepID=UPI002E116CB3|nr:alpha/beta hydrolase [Nonomuraea glycinis]
MIRRSYVDTRFGQLHLAECGTGRPVLFLHQTPRSWREYAAVLPIAGREVRAIAMDTLGFGQSARVTRPWSIELFADGVEALLDALGLAEVSLVGHHTGAVVAVEVAARSPERVRALVLSGMPYVDEARRRRVRAGSPIDHVLPRPDGGHLTELWGRRRDFYRQGEEPLLTRFVADALEVVDRVEEGHVRVNEYRMEERLPLVRSPALVVCGALDGHSLPDVPALTERLGCRSLVVAEAGVPLPEQRPEEFARAVLDFVGETHG